ncbi:hypothetical protein [Staphylococcus sp. GDY8P90P]|uniref:hypothetical protein n=1 Tax=Staphylococcus sp. GDY8P90P TaxID=2804141 RepID=UPI001AEC27D6|nr:hypothetical protein [Staphylococcus sp. GDY8P90P]
METFLQQKTGQTYILRKLFSSERYWKNQFYKIENYRVINIKTKLFKAIKDAMIIIFIILLITTLLDYMNLNIHLNQFGNKIGNLGLINIYENKNLNGLLSLGFILAGLSFIYDMFFKKAKTEVEENGRKTEKNIFYKKSVHLHTLFLRI